MRKAENFQPPSSGSGYLYDPTCHSTSGPINVQFDPSSSPSSLERTFSETLDALGLPSALGDDLTCGNPAGSAQVGNTKRGNTRVTAYRGYLRDQDIDNLTSERLGGFDGGLDTGFSLIFTKRPLRQFSQKPGSVGFSFRTVRVPRRRVSNSRTMPDRRIRPGPTSRSSWRPGRSCPPSSSNIRVSVPIRCWAGRPSRRGSTCRSG